MSGGIASAAEAPGFLGQLLRIKWRIAGNHLANLRNHMWIHLGVALLIVFMLVGGGTFFFSFIFRYLQNLQPFGPPLMNRVIQMVLLTFFSMLIFSNAIIMLTTTYFSREVEFLMSQPVSHRRLFFGKLLESTVYSSWAFVLLAFPFFMGLSRARELGVAYCLGAVVLIVPFLIIPSTIGAGIALLITAWCPPRKMVRYALSLAALSVVTAGISYRQLNLRKLVQTDENAMLSQMMQFMGIGDKLGLPSGWLGRGLLALEGARWSDALFWGAVLWSTALMGLVVADWLAGPLYYKGWCTARGSDATRRKTKGGGLYGMFDRLLRRMPATTRALVTKDLTVFWRDPAQWGQLCMLFGLLFVYIINLRSASEMKGVDIPFWKSLISVGNIGATGFVLSILSTRFVYPMLSLEGKQQWIIGLAPVSRTRMVWIKFYLSWFSSLMLIVPLALLSNWMLDVPASIYGVSLVTALCMALGLSSLAVGLGALLPNFTEDNPSRIANGLGGTINMIASLIYMTVMLTLEGPWIHALLNEFPQKGSDWWWVLGGAAAGWVVLQLLIVAVPLGLGLRRWRRMEF